MFISKRIMIITSIAVAIIMLAAGVGLVYAFTALGQQTTATANLSATATAAAAVAVPSPKPPGPRRVTGVIQSLGTSSFMMTVQRDKKTVSVTVSVTASTKYMHAGKAASFSDLQVGQTVAVMGTVDIKALTVQATRVVISPPPPKPTATPTVNPTATATP